MSQVVVGFSGKKTQLGVKMSDVKKIGSLNLKALIEDDKLLVSDLDLISELTIHPKIRIIRGRRRL